MFLFYRLRALAALAFLAAAMMSMTQVTHAQSGSPASSAAPQGPPILATNDPQNPFHYTADQQHELFALKVQFQQQATQVMNDKTLSESQKQAKFQAMQKQAFDQFNSTLTPEQKQMMKAATDKRNQVFALRQANMVKVRALSEKLSDSLTAAQKKQKARPAYIIQDRVERPTIRRPRPVETRPPARTGRSITSTCASCGTGSSPPTSRP